MSKYLSHLSVFFLLPLFFCTGTHADIYGNTDVREFIDEMNQRYDFDKNELAGYFRKININQNVLEAMRRPAEIVWSWDKYRNNMLSRSRTNDGVRFWRDNRDALERAYKTYGVAPEIIVAIMGIETSYGRRQGGFRVFEALATLAFEYPREKDNYEKRSLFFRKQLEHFLLLAREEKTDPLTLMGSYAGALGQPQFMPDSYRDYAVDFDNDGHRNIWSNNIDTIGSIANFLAKKGSWQKNEPVAIRTHGFNGQHSELLSDNGKIWHSLRELKGMGIEPEISIDSSETQVTLHELETGDHKEYWAAFNNFHAIMSYNPRIYYAMSVFLLSQEIQQRYSH